MADVTVADALRRAETSLRAAGVDAPRIQARALLAHALGVDGAGLLARLREFLPADCREAFESLVRRRCRHEPLQYLLGRAAFLDFELAVQPGVFIPRPESELVVAAALRIWDAEAPMAIDVGTGSGAIALALARARPQARVLALEISPAAAAQAAHNTRLLGLQDRVQVIRSDLLECLAPGSWQRHLGLIVCNPPYARDQDVVQPEVRDYEPRLAWEAGVRGTEVYERLLPQAARLLSPGRPLVLELGYDQGVSVPSLLQGDGRWSGVTVERDFQDLPRVLCARRESAPANGRRRGS